MASLASSSSSAPDMGRPLFIEDNGLALVKDEFNKLFDNQFLLLSREEYLDTFIPTRQIVDIQKFITKSQAQISNACGGDAVSRVYRIGAVYKALTQPQFDFLAIVKGKILVAFIIPQLGECKRHKDFWCVNLLCANLPGSGKFLLNAMSFCSKREAVRYEWPGQKVILELAGSYENHAGLLTYFRSGFRKDINLYHNEGTEEVGGVVRQKCFLPFPLHSTAPGYVKAIFPYTLQEIEYNKGHNCLCDPDTLPMSLDLDSFTERDFISFMGKGRASFDPEQVDESGTIATLSRADVKPNSLPKDDLVAEYLAEREALKCGALANEALKLEKESLESKEPDKQKNVQDKYQEARQCYSIYPSSFALIQNKQFLPPGEKELRDLQEFARQARQTKNLPHGAGIPENRVKRKSNLSPSPPPRTMSTRQSTRRTPPNQTGYLSPRRTPIRSVHVNHRYLSPKRHLSPHRTQTYYSRK